MCPVILRMEERKYYNNLNLKCLKDNRTFWKSQTPFPRKMYYTPIKTVLVKNNKILNHERLVSETVNTFSLMSPSLGSEDNYPPTSDLDYTTNPITKIINTYSNHRSIVKIK